MADEKEPTIDWAYIRSTGQQIAALHLRSGSLRTKVLELFDVANNIGKDDHLDGFTAAAPLTQQKRTEVAAQINSLEADENRNTEAVEELEAELREHWAKYAAFQCRALCDCVRRKLPRELRIMVFKALCEDVHHTITDWNVQALSTTPADPVALVESWSGRDTGHCFEARFVGLDLQQEIVEAWWRMSTFEFKTSQLIPKFLCGDFWGTTVEDRIRCVIIDLSYRCYNRRFPFALQADLKTTVNGTDLDAELGYISRLSNTSKVGLAIKKRDFRNPKASVEQIQHAFLHTASQLFPRLERLQKDGYRLFVLVDGDITIEVEKSDLTIEGWRKQFYDAEEVSRLPRDWA
ncbi:uncharacterized protein N0V89_007964 [Didymosphaeria variabile]|uniref:Uncharacterized protein n=1 Tax=Didymosphaeria variabile TaxID=1932322 RepID=A0A9W8XF29_9PLEO|nr:uncharacterized protein N0V89_007964 [Didymosphaeria variabile]KAJ4349350.1 hypothetical protein N0V89_007964 [Didymosphaeria variabile]